jgi:two-component system chemotaxis response regulator CheY
MRILVADDDLGSRLVAQAVVEGLGHHCVVASDGAAAWQTYKESVPDVLVTDLMMPVVDGLELCRRIRTTEQDTYTYIVLVSSHGDRNDVLTGMQAGADDYLTKPLDPFELETRLLAAGRVTGLHAQLARYRADMAQLARTDALTGLRNRRGLPEELALLHARSQRYARSYSLALCDVDLFKSYNDTYGHQAGDDALRRVASALAAQTRDTDGLYRYGGEEFLLVLPEQTLPSVFLILERIRGTVQQLGMDDGAGSGLSGVTLSAGIASFVPGRDVTSEQLLREADEALYAAKSGGRNAVVAADPGRLIAQPPRDRPLVWMTPSAALPLPR